MAERSFDSFVGQDIEVIYKMGKACTATTSGFRTLCVTYLGLSTNFASCISVVGFNLEEFKKSDCIEP